MRLGSKLEVSFDIEPQVNDALVPYMILQPIVENAILHGAAGSRDGGWVKVACRVEEKTVFVEVSNNRVTVAAPRRDGLGLKNTRARLKNLFEQEASLEFTVSDGVAQARIQLPFITAREVVAP
jgi:two-component system sensor histidine kinase AlgZ